MEKNQTLLKTQRNEVFDILQKAGLEVADFSWIEKTGRSVSTTVSCFNYKEGRHYFLFDFDSFHGYWIYEFAPGGSIPTKEVYSDSGNLELRHVSIWALLLKREIDAPDLWAEIAKYQSIFSLTPVSQIINEAIPTYEVEKISKALNGLKTEIKNNFGISQQQEQLVNLKLDYLIDASKRQRRTDWTLASIGVFVTIFIGLAMAPEQAKKLWELFQRAVSPFLHLVGP